MKDKKFLWFGVAVFGWLVIIWISFLIAPTLGGGLSTVIPKLSEALSHPFYLVWSDNTLLTLFVLSLIYGLAILIYHYTKPNFRRREEHGSAKWGEVKEINKRYQQKPKDSNKILSQHLSIGYNAKLHRRNFNTIVVGGSGAGKTRFYAKPNLMQCNTSFVCLDPKG